MTKFDPKKLKELQEAAGQEEWNPGVGTGAMVRLVRYLHNYVNDIIQMSDELAMAKSKNLRGQTCEPGASIPRTRAGQCHEHTTDASACCAGFGGSRARAANQPSRPSFVG